MRLPQTESKKNSILPAFAVLTFGLHLLTLTLLMFHGSMLEQLKQQFIPQSLVQLVDGRTITVDSQQNLERHPETIRRFVAETMSFILTRSGRQPPETIWEFGSELFAHELQRKLPGEILPLTPSQQFPQTERGTETVLIIQKISQPKKIGEGKWKVDMLAHQLIFTDYDRLGEAIAFNKQILVRATPKPAISLPEAPQSWQITAYQLGEAKLEIYQICDIQTKNCF